MYIGLLFNYFLQLHHGTTRNYTKYQLIEAPFQALCCANAVINISVPTYLVS